MGIFIANILKEQKYEPAWSENSNLKLYERILLETLYQFTHYGKRPYSFAPLELKDLLGISFPTLKQLIESLKKKGYIDYRRKKIHTGSRIILWMKDGMEDFDTYFFDRPLTLYARSLFLLMYKATEGRRKGLFFTGLYKKIFKDRGPSMKRLIGELERHGLLVGRMRRDVYIFERLISLFFSYKDYPSPAEVSLESAKLYGLYISLFLLSNADGTVFYPISHPGGNRVFSFATAASTLKSMGYIEKIGMGSYRLKVIPEAYRSRFIKDIFL